jgi:hypothetical protein
MPISSACCADSTKAAEQHQERQIVAAVAAETRPRHRVVKHKAPLQRVMKDFQKDLAFLHVGIMLHQTIVVDGSGGRGKHWTRVRPCFNSYVRVLKQLFRDRQHTAQL